MVPMMMPNAATAAVSMRFGLGGPCETVTTACAAGTHAIGNAARLVATGRSTVAVAGGAEAVMVEIAEAGFRNMTALSNTEFSRPFDVERDGFVMGEGAGILILEEWEHATRAWRHDLRRGPRRGLDRRRTPHHRPRPLGSRRDSLHGVGARGRRRHANDVSHINAHGTSTPLNDLAESVAVRKVFGDDAPPVTSIKGHLGHSLAAAGALEGVASVMTLVNQVIPPTAGTTVVDPEVGLDVVIGAPRAADVEVILSNSFGFGGHNGSVVFRRFHA